MLTKLQFLFTPHEKNNQKAKTLHLSSLLILFFLIIGFQGFLTLVTRVSPGVLGFASDISIENLIETTNQRRAEYGLPRLAFNQSLAEAAQQKASAMFTFGCWSHNCNGKTPWWFFKNASYQYLYAGENLARDFADSESVVAAWMASPTHRDNILGEKYKEFGFAVVDGVLNGEETTLVVQLFGTPEGEPEIAGGAQEIASQVRGAEEKVSLTAEVMAVEPIKGKIKPVVSAFMLTKGFYLLLVGVLIVVLLLDGVLIYQRRTVRVSGKSFIHLSFFTIIFISILLYYQGQII